MILPAKVSPIDWVPSEGIGLDGRTMEVVRRTSSVAIVAGPGAGKTELLAQRASFLLQTGACQDPRRILAISFKRDAAKNLRERVEARLGRDLAVRLESYTFDAFAKSLVDRFGSALPVWCRPTRDYRLEFPGYRDWREFAERISPPSVSGPASVSSQQIEKRHAHFADRPGPLPLKALKPASQLDLAVRKWWKEHLDARPSKLTFAMISTLAGTVLRHNPSILKALRCTYSHVFLDEFQDTTELQYALLREAFEGSSAVLTAVGDTKQRIMTWAGAVPESFDWLARDFGAERVALGANFRSNRRIVEIVNALAKAVEPDALTIECARSDDPVPEVADAILEFADRESEASDLAKSIALETDPEKGSLRPDDFLLLVRQEADDIEADLQPAFAATGLTLRNEARKVADVAIQDLMTEPLVDLAVSVIQLACDDREGAPFQRVRKLIGYAFGLDDERPESHFRLDETIRRAVIEARRMIQATRPIDADMDVLVDVVLKAFDRNLLCKLSPEYDQAQRMATIENSMVTFLTECASAANGWPELVTQFTGRGQVRLMTVHKSKGLEAHTVVFLHLQDDAFHKSADMDEEKFMFFVACSRARERLFVTATSPRRARVELLWDMLEAAGMKGEQSS